MEEKVEGRILNEKKNEKKNRIKADKGQKLNDT